MPTFLTWSFNGRQSFCNYRCPECYCGAQHNEGHHFQRTVSEWMQAFEKLPEQAYFVWSWGEPALAEVFHELGTAILKKHIVHVITNLSEESVASLDELIAQAGTTNLRISSSWHPKQAERAGQTWAQFVEHLEHFRDYHGIYVPACCVLIPPYIKNWAEKYDELVKRELVCYGRRYIGMYKDIWYPQGHTLEDRAIITKYISDEDEKYILNEEPTQGMLCPAGMVGSSMSMDCYGNLYRCVMSGCANKDGDLIERAFTNIFNDNFAFMDKPEPCPVRYCASMCSVLQVPGLGLESVLSSGENFITGFLRNTHWRKGKHKPWLPEKGTSDG